LQQIKAIKRKKGEGRKGNMKEKKNYRFKKEEN